MVREFREYHTKDAGIFVRVKRVLWEGKSEHQNILVLDTETFGKMLILDGAVMFTERDAFIYHEMLVHPAMCVHEGPRRVLIIGGGDGYALYEVLKYPVEHVTLVELDRKVVEVCCKFFDKAGAFEDERVELVIGDGTKFVETTEGKVDVIYVDSTDPVGAAKALFSEQFYRNVHEVLGDGILVAQTESPFYHIEFIQGVKSKLTAVFQNVHFYTVPIPTYPGGWWSFVFASDRYTPYEIRREPPADLKYYTHEVHRAAFVLPKWVEEKLK